MQGFNKLAIALASTAVITACGGSGGSDNNETTGGTTTPPAVTATTVSGSATKGIISNAQVEVFEILSDGSLSAEAVGEATTDASGEYEVELSDSYTGGPLKVTISAVDGTTMICDAPSGCGSTAYGDNYTLATGFELSALLPEADGNTVSVHVTPLTDMATKLAEEEDTLNVAAIANANDVVRQTLVLQAILPRLNPLM
ncbi:MAG: hypothetical protein JKY66_08095 [Spongiibacteraceae bacterium]|nr:hypothetical protein [Spongiibacteraceae bacterium]